MTTPTQLITRIRQVNNIVGDSFFSDDELLQQIFYAHSELAMKVKLIERVFSTTTVDGTQEYSLPARAFSIKRIEYDGKKLQKIDFDIDDEVTGYDADTTNKGTPLYWFQWNNSAFLRPIPDSALTLKVFTFNRPQELTITSSLEISDDYDAMVMDFVKIFISEKENALDKAAYFARKWAEHVALAERMQRIKQRGERFASVKDDELINRRMLEV